MTMAGGARKAFRAAVALALLVAAVQCNGAIKIRLEGCAKGEANQLGGADYLAFYAGPSGDDACGSWRFKSVFRGRWSDLPPSFYQNENSGMQLTRYAESGFSSGGTLTTHARGLCKLTVVDYPVKIKLENCAKSGSEPQLGGADYLAYYLPGDECGRWVFKSVFRAKWSILPSHFYNSGLSGDQLRQYASSGFASGGHLTTSSRGKCDLSLVTDSDSPAPAKPSGAGQGSVGDVVEIDNEEVQADLDAIKAAQAKLKADQDKLAADKLQGSLGNAGSHSPSAPTGSSASSGSLELYAGIYPGYNPCQKLIRNSPGTIFVFNDNLTQFNLKGTGKAAWCSAGGGNACLRPFNEGCSSHVDGSTGVAFGIPTGIFSSPQGQDEQAAMAEALTRLQNLLATGKYNRIMYSGGGSKKDLAKVGSGIFNVPDSVKSDFVNVLLTATGLSKSDIKISK